MAPKKTIERTAASSRPKRTPKPTTTTATTATTPSAPAPKPKKKPTTATKKTATKPTALKKQPATKVLKKKAPATAKKLKTTTIKGREVPLNGRNPLGPEAQKKIDKRKEAEKVDRAKYRDIDARYTTPMLMHLQKEYGEGVAKGEWETIGSFEAFVEFNKNVDEKAWNKAHEKTSAELEKRYQGNEYHALMEEMREKQNKDVIPHSITKTEFLYWKEMDKERSKVLEVYKAKEKGKKKNKQSPKKHVVSANHSSPVKNLQETVVNTSPVKKIRDAVAAAGSRGRSKSPEKKKVTSYDSGYQADSEQQSGVMSRTWELAANAVEAMRSAVNPE